VIHEFRVKTAVVVLFIGIQKKNYMCVQNVESKKMHWLLGSKLENIGSAKRKRRRKRIVNGLSMFSESKIS
jgi:hypothetical protein